MDITVRLFASYADVLGSSHATLTVSDPVTVAGLRAALSAMSPRLAPRPLIAVNEEYADDDQFISSGDEVAVIPPVSGG